MSSFRLLHYDLKCGKQEASYGEKAGALHKSSPVGQVSNQAAHDRGRTALQRELLSLQRKPKGLHLVSNQTSALAELELLWIHYPDVFFHIWKTVSNCENFFFSKPLILRLMDMICWRGGGKSCHKYTFLRLL